MTFSLWTKTLEIIYHFKAVLYKLNYIFLNIWSQMQNSCILNYVFWLCFFKSCMENKQFCSFSPTEVIIITVKYKKKPVNRIEIIRSSRSGCMFWAPSAEHKSSCIRDKNSSGSWGKQSFLRFDNLETVQCFRCKYVKRLSCSWRGFLQRRKQWVKHPASVCSDSSVPTAVCLSPVCLQRE